MSVLRDVFRRKGRSILTISGIGVAVFTLVVLGSVAENMNVYVSRLVGYYEDVVVVVEAENANFVGMSLGSRPLSAQTIQQMGADERVKAVSPQVNLALEDGSTSVVPHMVLGSEPGSADYESFPLGSGRQLQSGDRKAVVVGYDLAERRGVRVGESFDVRGEPYEVVGTLDRTYVNLLDSSVFVTLADAQQMYYDALPEAFRTEIKPEDLVLQANVYATPEQSPDDLAEALNREVDGILATGPTKMLDTVNGLLALINVVVLSVAGVALVVSVLSIVNTMLMAVGERTREIGVKRALGGSRWTVARDVLLESGAMGLLGGLAGVAIGVAVALGLNSALVAVTGTSALVPTPRLALLAMLFAVGLGGLGGLYPAWRASHLDPATALAQR